MYLAYDFDGWGGRCSMEYFNFELWLLLVLSSECRNWSFV